MRLLARLSRLIHPPGTSRAARLHASVTIAVVVMMGLATWYFVAHPRALASPEAALATAAGEAAPSGESPAGSGGASTAASEWLTTFVGPGSCVADVGTLAPAAVVTWATQHPQANIMATHPRVDAGGCLIGYDISYAPSDYAGS